MKFMERRELQYQDYQYSALIHFSFSTSSQRIAWETGSGKKTSIRRVYDAATDDGSQNGDFGEFLCRNFGDVVGKNDEVGVLAGFQRTLLPFLELRVGRA